MDEATKTNQFRHESFFKTYLSGTVLDIGAGKDLVCPHAQGFDMEDGDANHLDRYFPPESFNTVHSSHSLEHMHNPEEALNAWWKLVKSGGYLILVVPDEDLYEQGIWPSVFNTDHKSTFRLDKEKSWSPVSYDIRVLCTALLGGVIVSAQRQSNNFDSSLLFPQHLKAKQKYTFWQKKMFSIAKRLPNGGLELVKKIQIGLIKKGYPFDQTKYNASAQIEIIVQKK